MDEEKLNELFRTLLENKQGISASDCESTLDSSLGDETHLTYDDALAEFMKIVENLIFGTIWSDFRCKC